VSEHAVYVEFGGSKHRIGTAYQQQDGGFTLVLGGTLSLGPGQPASSRGGAAGASGPCFPNYGRSKGAPIFGASMGDLEFYANGARRTLNDASKSRWHAKERELLDAIEAEITRQGGTPQGDGGYTGASGDSTRYASTRNEDDDIPFN